MFLFIISTIRQLFFDVLMILHNNYVYYKASFLLRLTE
uniref:Uncharacterized protein n=1 Tax=Alsidium seaforthii TaxID=2007182 RepID=A0A1Z1MDH3_9FLOR|nr:hypothetical protein [Bryothamnion seaforthii]ARW63922.1 hypothetical protein [Bryothamnion seaforthii]